MQLHLDNKELFLGHQATDDEIRSSYKGLLADIRAWALKFNNPLPSATPSPDEKLLPSLRQVAPLCGNTAQVMSYLSDPKKRRFVARGLVVLTICDRVFRTVPSEFHNGSQAYDIWVDNPARENFYSLENRLYHAGKQRVNLFPRTNTNGLRSQNHLI